MEQILNDNLIILNRGDSFSRPLFLNRGTKLQPMRYILSDGNGDVNKEDEIYFAIMEPNQTFENAIIKKKYTYRDLNSNNDVVIELRPEDTCELIPGQYFFTVKLRIPKDKYVLIPTSNFTSVNDYISHYILINNIYTPITADNINSFNIELGKTKAYDINGIREIINTVIPNTELRIID